MNDSKLLDRAVDWTGQTWAERLDIARSLLFTHGFIPMSQNDRIFAKLSKQYASAIEARSDATGTGAAEGKSAVGDSRDALRAQPPTKEPTP